MVWETFRRRSRQSPKSPTITISKGMMIGLNTAVVQLLGDCKYALLMFDREKNMVGIRLLKNGEPDTYPIGVVPKKSHASISGVSFMKTYGIVPTETRAFPATYDEKNKILIADISDMMKEGKKKGKM